MCLCQTGIKNNEHSLLHCPCHSSHRRDHLDRISNVADVDSQNLSSIDLCNLLLYGNSCFSVDTNHRIIESTIFFMKSTSRFKQIWANYQTNCHHLLRLWLLFLPLYFFCIAFSFHVSFCFSLVNKSCC